MRGFANRLMALAGGLRMKALRRSQSVAALAIVGLYLQLTAGAFCTAGLASGPDISGVPICHSSAGGASKSDPAPQSHQQSCPFCALHCHAALLLTPTLLLVKPAAGAAARQLAQIITSPRLRFAVAAQPRGPPLFS